ncbi:MAG TPA: 3-deoxy-7-phosphoheptulonate synthase [Methylomirabilota bacterium]|jgi:3-deoxy-7-phosphoheptulonate synthase|nr:3-deoxy-7-phosphoheptulonate synthase [Methylomirabilota bacterium]
MRQTNNLHVVDTSPLITPTELKQELPISERVAETVASTRDAIRAILQGQDRRLLAVVGPCSIHDVDAARDYAERLLKAKEEFKDRLLIVMRVYFEKPRTTTGWKGLINDPHLDGSHDMTTGLRLARKLLLDLAEAGLPSATEMLDPITPQYLAELVTWTGIGARTSESQTHREMASGLSMPVGFKNSTDGSIAPAVNAISAALHPHRFLGIDSEGKVSVVSTTGNPDCHLVLRGGSTAPNYDAESVGIAAKVLQQSHLCTRIMVDCSHGNAQKDFRKQPLALASVASQVRTGSPHLMGVMIESNLVAGKQPFPVPRTQLVYGQSITDPCVDFPTTIAMLRELAEAVDLHPSARFNKSSQGACDEKENALR